jgi:hypothetical protein
MIETRQDHVQRLRMLAALVMVSASASAGFLGGRMSAWLVPVDDKRPALEGRESRPDKVKSADASPARSATTKEEGKANPDAAAAPPPPSSRPAKEASGGPEPAASAPKTPKKTGSDAELGSLRGSLATGSAIVAGLAQSPAPRDLTPDKLDVPAKGSGLGEEGSPKPASPGLDTPSAVAMEQCQRRYSSFRSSDGTYQPYDGGPRRLCPLLR